MWHNISSHIFWPVILHIFSKLSQKYFQGHKNWILFPRDQEDELLDELTDEQEFHLCEQKQLKEFLYRKEIYFYEWIGYFPFTVKLNAQLSIFYK